MPPAPSTPQRHARVSEIFLAACELKHAERPGFLAEACAGDGSLRDEVQALLDRDADPSSFINSPVLGSVAPTPSMIGVGPDSPSPVPIPERLGPYRVTGVLGRGGMGIVYRAEQERPRRAVALKVIRPELASASMLKRLEHEAEALARLQHPGIARIYGAGVFDGHDTPWGVAAPYMAMELINGVPVPRAAAEGAPSRRALLELFARVCDAVQHAHNRGVIHRDLKPGNILVDESGQPKVLDFGVARVTDADPSATLAGAEQVVGTLAYMSPEQAAGDPAEIDTRSDVYSLGAVLFELLAGRPPLALSGMAIPECLRAIRESPRPRLGVISRELRGDLETIVAKALDADRTRRYQSAAELAADVRCFLTHRPISARPAGAVYRMRRFVRRNGVLVGGIAGTVLALAVGLVAALNQAAKAREAAKSEFEARRGAERDAAVSREIGGLLDGMIRGSDQFVAGGPDVTARELVDRAAGRLDRSSGMDPLVEAAVRKTVGATYRGLDLPALAEPQLQRSVALFEATTGAKTDDLWSARYELALTMVAQRRLDEAEPLLGRYRDYLEHSRQPGDDSIATTILEQANCARLRGDLKRAESLAREAAAAAEAVPALTYADADAPRVLGSILVMAGRPADASPYLADACSKIEQLEGTSTERWANARAMYANALLETGGAAEAERILKDNLELSERMRGPDSLLALAAAGQLARAVDRNGRLDEAATLYLRSWTGQQRLLGERDSRTMTAAGNYATLLAGQRRYAEALPLFESLAQARLANEGMASMDTLVAFNNLAGCKLRVEDYEGAAKTAGEALVVAESALPAGSVYIGALHNNLGRALRKLGRHEEAEPHLLAAHGILAKGFGPNDPRTIGMASELVALYDAWGKTEAAQEWRERAKPAGTP